MDHSLEGPSNPHSSRSVDMRDEEDENSSGDEDGALDWSKIPLAPGRPIIPKRGEKDFEPSVEGGSGLQLHVLDRARAAMLEALKAERNTSSKSISYGIWHPGISRVHVTVARGVHFGTMGHSVPRCMSSESSEGPKTQKRLELLPEEALYLVERGTLFCTKENVSMKLNVPGMEDIEGAPMTVQQAYTEMIGSESLTLEKYQVYAYLKRLGFSITRSVPPTPSYPSAQPFASAIPTSSLLERMFSWIPSWISQLRQFFLPRFNWWKPLSMGGLFDNNFSSDAIFKSLRFLPSGHSVALRTAKQPTTQISPYQIFYNLYKPSTPFRKTAPGPPDFSLVVINARTTPMPSLHELTALFNILPEMPPPPPRHRRSLPGSKFSPATVPQKQTPISEPTSKNTLFALFPWVFAKTESDSPLSQTRKPNHFSVLKAGKKSVVIAAVESGSVSFFRFGQGAFEEFPVV